MSGNLLKKAVVTSFFLLAAYFYGIGFSAFSDKAELAGFLVIGTLHTVVGIGVWIENENLISGGKYLVFLDLIFSILWIMAGVIIQGGTMMFLSGLILVILSGGDFKGP